MKSLSGAHAAASETTTANATTTATQTANAIPTANATTTTTAIPTTTAARFERLRWGLAFFRAHAGTRQAPPPREQRIERVLYGLAQPVLGLRTLLSDPQLLREGLVPAAWLAAFCSLVALLKPEEGPLWLGRVKAFYKTFAVLAPVPSIIFAKHYARLSALVRWRLGFGACGPREYPVSTSLKRAIQQSVIVFAGVIPFAAIWKILPWIGAPISQFVIAAWGVHWVVVDAFDDARVLLPGETIRSAEAEDRRAPSPWFVRLLDSAADGIPLRIAGRLLGRFARFCDRLALPWRGELALMEANPSVALGFALTTASLLATPVLNLLFRPTILVASAHLLGHLEAKEATAAPVSGIRTPA